MSEHSDSEHFISEHSISEHSISEQEKPINSPCISICALNDEEVCVGCYRTADEIREWMAMDNRERKDVLKSSMLRSRKFNPFV